MPITRLAALPDDLIAGGAQSSSDIAPPDARPNVIVAQFR
jgi:hypothetical protein